MSMTVDQSVELIIEDLKNTSGFSWSCFIEQLMDEMPIDKRTADLIANVITTFLENLADQDKMAIMQELEISFDSYLEFQERSLNEFASTLKDLYFERVTQMAHESVYSSNNELSDEYEEADEDIEGRKALEELFGTSDEAHEELKALLYDKISKHLVTKRAEEINLELNDVLIDEDVFQWVNWKTMKLSKDVYYYVHLCFFIECMVLHNRTVFYYKEEELSGIYRIFRTFFTEEQEEALRNEGLIEFILEPILLNVASDIDLNKLHISGDDLKTKWARENLDVLLGRTAGETVLKDYLGSFGDDLIESGVVHECFELSNVTDPGRWFLYHTKESRYSDLTHAYHQAYINVIKALRKDVELAEIVGYPKTLFVPPISANILAKDIRDEFDLIDLIVKSRREFKNVRDEFTRYEEKMTSRKSTLKDALKARNKLITRLEMLSKSWEEREIIQLAEYKDLFQLFPELSNNKLDTSDIKNIIMSSLSRPVVAGLQRINLRNIFYLFSLKNSFRNLKNPLRALDVFLVFENPHSLNRAVVDGIISKQYKKLTGENL